MGRQMFAHSRPPYTMQDGGLVHPMPDGSMMPDSAMAPMPQGLGSGPAPMMPDPAMAPMPPSDMANVDINQAAQGAAQQGLDPAVLEGMLGDYSQQMESMDNAEDFETVINGIRGDQLPMEARYAELAGVVGPEDAQSTPESVLTLVQPILQIAAVDQGIGGLAQEEMSAPIEGPMAEGIMSTVNLGAPEGPAPVNFNHGGYVTDLSHDPDGAAQITSDGGDVPVLVPPALGGRQGDIFRQQQAFIKTALLDREQQAADFEEQKKMTKAQMWFDIAQGALAFASPGDRQMSPAERLAQSFSPVLGSIGARAGELNKFKQAQGDEEKQYDVAAFQSAQGIYAAENAAKAAENLRQQDIADRPPNPQAYVDQNDPSNIRWFDLNNKSDREAVSALGDDWVPIKTPSVADLRGGPGLGGGLAAAMLELISDQDTIDAYADNTVDPNIANLINNWLTEKTQATEIWDPKLNKYVLVSGLRLSPMVLAAIKARGEKGASMPDIRGENYGPPTDSGDSGDSGDTGDTGNKGGKIRHLPNGEIDYSPWENNELTTISGSDLTLSQGWTSTIIRLFNGIAGQYAEGFKGSGYAGPIGEATSKADRELKALARRIMSAARAGVKGKVFATDIELLLEEVAGFSPSGGKTDTGARDQLVVVRGTLAALYKDAQFVLDRPGEQELHAEALSARNKLDALLGEVTAAILIYNRYLETDPMDEVQDDQAQTESITGNLRRLREAN